MNITTAEQETPQQACEQKLHLSHSNNTLLDSKKRLTVDYGKHVAPKYTILGTLIPAHKQQKGRVLDPNPPKMPISWNRPTTITTKINGSNSLSNLIRTKKALESARRQEKVPDKTFDLDGDGQVSQKDYFLAK